MRLGEGAFPNHRPHHLADICDASYDEFSGHIRCYGSVFLLTEGKYGTQTVSNWLYMKVQLASSDMDPMLYRASALGLVLTLISCAVALTTRYFLNRHVQEVEF